MKKKKSDSVPLKEAISLTMRGYKMWWDKSPEIFITSAICSIFDSATPYVGIYLSARIINELAGQRNPDVLTRLVLITLISAAVLSLTGAILSRVRNYHNSATGKIETEIYTDKLLSMDFKDIDDSQVRDLLSQIKQNNNWGGWGLTKLRWQFDDLIKSTISIIGAVTLSVTLFTSSVPESGGYLTILNNPLLVTLILLIMFAITFLSPILSNKADSYWVREFEQSKMGNRHFSFYGFMGYNKHRALDIRMYRQDRLCVEMMTPSDDDPESNEPGIVEWAKGPMGALHAASSAVSQVFTGVVYIFVCLKALGGAFGIGSVTQYIGSITALAGGIASLVSTLGELRNNASFLRTIYKFFDLPNEMYQGSLTVEKRSDKKYDIEFRNVSFKYPHTDTYALRNVSMKFKIGERLAVVGMNGSGKTTFIKLLCRLYDPQEGEILLNGIDIRKYDYLEYMSIFSVVFQDFKLLAFNLGQNVAANVNYDTERAVNSLNEAGFGDRLKEMTAGLETYLYREFDDKGVEISGGEAQKIALARTLYKNASFVILDEPTAALDPIAEYEVYSKMNDIIGKRTAVFISHRLSSCRFCHNIAVFHEGEVIQVGGHDELLEDTNGKYHELWHAQAQYYTV
jgi:ABC-type multidrug transport system, ATPase and permease components